MALNLTNEQKGKLVDLALKDPAIVEQVKTQIREEKEGRESVVQMAWYLFFMFGLPLILIFIAGISLLLK